MELQTPDGYTLIRTTELHQIRKCAREYSTFRVTYYKYNKKLNKLFKLMDAIINKEGQNAVDTGELGDNNNGNISRNQVCGVDSGTHTVSKG